MIETLPEELKTYYESYQKVKSDRLLAEKELFDNYLDSGASSIETSRLRAQAPTLANTPETRALLTNSGLKLKELTTLGDHWRFTTPVFLIQTECFTEVWA